MNTFTKLVLGSALLIPLEIGILAKQYRSSTPSSPVQVTHVVSSPSSPAPILTVPITYPSFLLRSELPFIMRHAERYQVDPALLMAIRLSEQGTPGKEYGIIPQGAMKQRYLADEGYMLSNRFYSYHHPLEKQVAWCASEVREAHDLFRPTHGDFITFLGARYAPVTGDRSGLNKHWVRNVQNQYQKLRTERSK